MLIILQSIWKRKNTWLVSLTPAAALQSKMQKLKRAARGGFHHLLLLALLAQMPGEVVGEYIYSCIPELFHIQRELWTCAVSTEPHWRQWGKCTEISLTNIVPSVLLPLVENKSSDREILSCGVWSWQLKSKQVNFSASKKSPTVQQGGADLQQAAVSYVWSGEVWHDHPMGLCWWVLQSGLHVLLGINN